MQRIDSPSLALRVEMRVTLSGAAGGLSAGGVLVEVEALTDEVVAEVGGVVEAVWLGGRDCDSAEGLGRAGPRWPRGGERAKSSEVGGGEAEDEDAESVSSGTAAG